MVGETFHGLSFTNCPIDGEPRRVIVPLLAILLGAGILSYTVGKDFLPPLDEGAIWIQVQLPPGISIEKSKEMGAELRKTLKEFKEVSYVMTQVGRDDEGRKRSHSLMWSVAWD